MATSQARERLLAAAVGHRCVSRGSGGRQQPKPRWSAVGGRV